MPVQFLTPFVEVDDFVTQHTQAGGQQADGVAAVRTKVLPWLHAALCVLAAAAAAATGQGWGGSVLGMQVWEKNQAGTNVFACVRMKTGDDEDRFSPSPLVTCSPSPILNSIQLGPWVVDITPPRCKPPATPTQVD